MEFFIKNLDNLLSIAGLFFTLYAFYSVRRAKFVLIRRNEKTLVDNIFDYDIKYDGNRIESKLIYQNFIICYLGANSTKNEDIEIPLTICSNNDDLKFIDYNIYKTTHNFNPKVILREKKIEIQNKSFNHGDTINIGFLTESKANSLTVNHRFVNVDNTIKDFKNDGSNIIYFLLFSLVAIAFTYILSQSINSIIRIKDNDIYNIEYNYKNQTVNEENASLSYLKIYDIFNDELLKELPKVNNTRDRDRLKDSLIKLHPILLAEKKAKDLKKDKKFELEKNYKINDDLSVVYHKPFNESIDNMQIGFIVVLPFVIFYLLFCVIKIGINIYFVRQVNQFIKKG